MAFHKCFHNLQKKTEALPLQVSLSPPMRKITIVIIIAKQAPVYQEPELLSEAALHTGKVQLSRGAFHLKHSLTWTSRVEGVVVVLFWFLIIQASPRLPYRHWCFTGSAPGWQGLPSSCKDNKTEYYCYCYHLSSLQYCMWASKVSKKLESDQQPPNLTFHSPHPALPVRFQHFLEATGEWQFYFFLFKFNLQTNPMWKHTKGSLLQLQPGVYWQQWISLFIYVCVRERDAAVTNNLSIFLIISMKYLLSKTELIELQLAGSRAAQWSSATRKSRSEFLSIPSQTPSGKP